MTYIVALQKSEHNFSAIISDLMVSQKDIKTNKVIKSDNTVLKTGLLFKGCIFGLAGDANAGIDFIKQFKEIVNPSEPIEKNWKLFQEYIKTCSIVNSGEVFKIIISCRVKGRPNLFLFNSNSRSLSKITNEIFTLGSGKEILDKILNNRRKIVEKIILEQMEKAEIPILYFPYFYCLWLSELTMGFEYSLLEKKGVGGLFHFCYQTKNGEGRQKPAVFVFSVPDKKNRTIYNYIYRVMLTHGFLVIDNPLATPQRLIITSSAERRDIDSLNEEALKTLGNMINQKADEERFYYFCGFGLPNPDTRGSFVCHISGPKGDLVVDKFGNIREDYKKIIERNINSVN